MCVTFLFFFHEIKKNFQVKIGDMIFMLGTVNKVKDRISETILNDKFKIFRICFSHLVGIKILNKIGSSLGCPQAVG